MLNLILNLIVLFIALIIQVCKWLFAAGKYVIVHILPVLWYWFVRIIPWAGIPIALLALWQLRERFLGRVVVYLGLGGIWWLTLDAPPWRYLLAGILLWECYCLIAAIVMGLRGHSFRVRLSKAGILIPSELAGVPAQVLSWTKRKKLAVADRSGNLCSTKFLDTVCRQLNVNGAKMALVQECFDDRFPSALIEHPHHLDLVEAFLQQLGLGAQAFPVVYFVGQAQQIADLAGGNAKPAFIILARRTDGQHDPLRLIYEVAGSGMGSSSVPLHSRPAGRCCGGRLLYRHKPATISQANELIDRYIYF